MIHALRARLEADAGQPVTLLETHISWVLLAGDDAYKVKKPLRLAFVDFSTPARRRDCCEEEVRLNRRLAPGLYLGVVPIRGTEQAPHLGGLGEVIDHAVHMRRFPAGALFAELLAAGRLEAADLDRLAHRLANFHRDAPVAPAGATYGLPDQVVDPVLELSTQLQRSGGGPGSIDLRDAIADQARVLRPIWLERRRAGAVRECHGDLHLSNVVRIDGDAIAFDCIEFDPALRWIDVFDDIAFLTMDLKAHGRGDLAYRFLDTYLQHTGDYAGLPVLRFYEIARALVRALVRQLRPVGAPTPTPTDPDYLACAERWMQGAMPTPRLLITHGLSGSGKSTLARQMLETVGAIRVRSDVERKRLFGLGALQSSSQHGLDLYTDDATRRTFQRLADLARGTLRAGYPVIVDAAFLRHAERVTFRALAAELGVPFAILDCEAAQAHLRQRVADRGAAGSDPSEADGLVLERQLATHEPLTGDELDVALHVVTDQPVDIATLCARWLAMNDRTAA